MFVFLVLASSLPRATAIFEEQVGRIDWYKQHIGKPKLAVFPRVQNPFAIVATESNVLAAVSFKSAELLWRQVLPEEESTDLMLLHKRTLFTMSNQGATLRAWFANDGSLIWDSGTCGCRERNS